MQKFDKDKDQDITLALIWEKLEVMEKNQIETLNRQKETNGRVKSLEIWKAYMIGGGLVIVTLIGWIMNSN